MYVVSVVYEIGCQKCVGIVPRGVGEFSGKVWYVDGNDGHVV